MSPDQEHSTQAITEVELDAVDLVGLSPSYKASGQPQTQLSSPVQSGSVSLERGEHAAAPMQVVAARNVLSQRTSWVGKRTLAIVGLTLIASAALMAHQFSAPEPVGRRTTIAWTPLPESGQLMVEDEEQAPAPPTLFANPFDPTEVFELPPGLTKEEAREMVAQLLLERARDRTSRR
jgi:hypothetical protein